MIWKHFKRLVKTSRCFCEIKAANFMSLYCRRPSESKPLLKRLMVWALCLAPFAGLEAGLAETVPVYKLQVAAEYPHNCVHFTQGLFFRQGLLYESVGLYGRSALHVKNPLDGRILRSCRLDERYFGEGAAEAWGRIYLLTWREETGFILDPDQLTIEGRFSYRGQGWGLTFDGWRLIRSNGGPFLFFHGPDGELQGLVLVAASGRPVYNLNELEWLPREKLVLANIWRANRVAAIDPYSGRVVFWLDLAAFNPFASGLAPEDAVANGLALDPEGDFLWLTGKLWPKMYKVVWPPAGSAALKE